MALRDKLAERMKPMLEPGEEVRHAFLCQSGPSPYWMFLSTLILFATRYYIVAVTDRRIVIARTPWWMTTKPREVVSRLPRAIQLGPVAGLWGGPLYLTPDGKKTWVNKRFQKDVTAADAELASSGTAPVATATQEGSVAALPSQAADS
jgi:hypothetical protein